MRDLEAKDFLVQQTTEQAALENVPLSDLEKRMMYFTESEYALEDPIKLNEEFEAAYSTEEYEAKISSLLHHAYKRLMKENPETVRQWKDAIRALREGDHYLLVLWNEKPEERPPHDALKLLGTAILVTVAGLALMMGLISLSDHFHWKSGPQIQTSMPVWMQRLLIVLVLGGYVYYVVLPWILKRPLPGISSLLVRILLVRRVKNREK